MFPLLEPQSGAKTEHVRQHEVRRLWAALESEDWLVFFQHAYRTKEWREMSAGRFAEACGGEGDGGKRDFLRRGGDLRRRFLRGSKGEPALHIRL